ncbi:tetratricopeptide repeat-containing sulfotransferase family protein [Loktanella sp. IMCC34160]|uniref:tetratricopeptide repeat-containing sulfotransferase family protein n=1 Tax=Loktanella sp. IMCC34160 TaxID=2510646 RepID=UPI0013ECE827|nr:tetratricopeptide repeat-containing sulfotransferase family protein [Loktanella sp. IMCC34160]
MQLNRAKILKKGEALIDERRYAEAERLYQEAIRQRPKDVKLYAALARLLMRHMKRAKHADQVIAHALKLDRSDYEVLREAAELCFRKDDLVAAKKYAKDSLVRGGNDPDTLYVAATVFEKLDEFDEAVECLDRVLKKRPDHLPSRILHAKCIRSLGRLDESASICRNILETHPNSLKVMGIYSESVKFKEGDPHVENLENTIIPALRDQGRDVALQTALKCLAKSRLDTGQHEEAFLLFKEAKELLPSQHDRAKQKTYVAELKANVAIADYFGRATYDEERPVLIVGMPRVGSTLLEQVIASHPQTAAVGESGALRSLLPFLGVPQANGAEMSKLIKTVSEEKLGLVRQAYLEQTANRRPGALRVVDKNLHNFELLGLFARMFPEARIIHARRDPMDNCVACYLQRLSKWHSYTDDLTSLGQYYREHIELMAHWKKVLPNPIMEVPYENMVADTEGMARKVIDFLGLEWDDACLNFQETENRAKTLSVWQVRQPIYKSSVKRWKKYEAHLDALKKELQPFYPNGFDD